MPDEGFSNTDQPSADELASRFDEMHEQTKHGGSEGHPNPATGDNYHPENEGGNSEAQDNMAGGKVDQPGERIV
jgi:hypothetical protein